MQGIVQTSISTAPGLVGEPWPSVGVSFPSQKGLSSIAINFLLWLLHISWRNLWSTGKELVDGVVFSWRCAKDYSVASVTLVSSRVFGGGLIEACITFW